MVVSMLKKVMITILCVPIHVEPSTLVPEGPARARLAPSVHPSHTQTPNSLPPLLCRQVRASNLQDLVYKQGQAGVTKATVSIVFDNAAKDRSPVGYEHLDEITVTRQLVIGGRSKYMINGRVAEPSCVG